MTRQSMYASAWTLLTALLLMSSSDAAEALKFSDLRGWWIATPSHGGETSTLIIHFDEIEGKPSARLALPAIGMDDIQLGEVILHEDSLDTKRLSFPLKWDAAAQRLTGLVPKDAAPIYDIPVEFRRTPPVAKSEAPKWPNDKPKVRWSVDIGGPAWAGLERDAKSQLLFAANDAGAVHAIDDRGVVQWRFETGKAIRGRPALIGAHLYVASDSGFLYKLDARSGKLSWRSPIDTGSPERIPTDKEQSRWDRYGSSIISDGQRVYVASRDKNLYALDVATGKEQWRVAAADMMTATPALYRDLVIFAAFDGKVQAVTAKDGALRWTYDAKLAVPGDLIVDADRVYVGSRTYDLIALEATSGKELWKHYYWFSWIESPPVIRDNTVYTGSSDAVNVYALDATSGSLRWKTAVPGWAWARPAVSDDLVVAGTVGGGAYPGPRSGSLVAIDRRTGALRWVYMDEPSSETIAQKKGWGFGSSPLIVGDRIYAMDLNGRVMCLERS